MSKTISMKLSAASIQQAITELKEYRISIEKKTAELQKVIADEIQSNAENAFSRAFEDITPLSGGPRMNLDVTVTVEKKDAVLVVVARGDDVIWCEFGTGVHHNGSVGSSPHPKGAENGFLIGMYGKGYGSRDMWPFKTEDGVKWTHGMKASQAMWKAAESIRNDYMSVVRRVFN